MEVGRIGHENLQKDWYSECKTGQGWLRESVGVGWIGQKYRCKWERLVKCTCDYGRIG